MYSKEYIKECNKYDLTPEEEFDNYFGVGFCSRTSCSNCNIFKYNRPPCGDKLTEYIRDRYMSNKYNDKRILSINAKCKDNFRSILLDNGVKYTYSGYVPEFFPEDHYGDNIILDIDIDTGQILNWKIPSNGELADIT
jgi:hypothetical protein